MPVNYGPNVCEVLKSKILIVDVVSMLPDVNSEKWKLVFSQILYHDLVGGLSVLKSVSPFVVDEPTPTGTLNSSTFCLEESLKISYTAPFFNKHFPERHGSVGFNPAVFSWCVLREVLPEELMVEITSKVELIRVHKLGIKLEVSCASCRIHLWNNNVEFSNVACGMLVVMIVHLFMGYHGYQSAKGCHRVSVVGQR